MRTLLLLSSLALAFTGAAQVFPVDTILNNGPSTKRINYVFLSDGFQAGELPAYITQVHAVQAAMFSQTPFQQYKNFFNIYAVEVPSVQSGADHPGTASDEMPGQPIINVNTYFNSTFDYSGIHRLVVPQNPQAINSVLISNFPNYDRVFILVNSPYYGGSGGTYATATLEGSSSEIAFHEVGHSFAGLADEYAVGGQGEAPNRTANTNPATIKWKNWLGDNNIGIFPIGLDGWQRPHQNCKMQFLGVPFCSVCAEAFVNTIYAFVTPIYSASPAAATVPVSGPTTFSAVLTLPEPNTLHTEWKLNAATVATEQDSITLLPAQLNNGSNTLTLYVTDQTTLSRSYWPNAGYVFSQSWVLTKSMSPVQTIGKPDKFYYQISPNPARDLLTVQGHADYALELNIEMYGATGDRVYRQRVAPGTSFQQNIDVSGFADGLYTVLLRLPNGYVVQEQILKVK